MMDKFYTGYCVGGCGEWLTEDSSLVVVLPNGELLCHYCKTPEALHDGSVIDKAVEQVKLAEENSKFRN